MSTMKIFFGRKKTGKTRDGHIYRDITGGVAISYDGCKWRFKTRNRGAFSTGCPYLFITNQGMGISCGRRERRL